MPTDLQTYSIADFCRAHRISRALLYRLWQNGQGPRRMRVGDRVLISAEAAADWRRQCEQGEGAA